MNLIGLIRQPLAKAWSDYARYRQIYNELRLMNDRELSELKLNRSDAPRIARETVRAERNYASRRPRFAPAALARI